MTVRSGVPEIKEKAIRFLHEIVSEETGELSAVTELTAVPIDTVLRKSRPFPDQVVERAGTMAFTRSEKR